MISLSYDKKHNTVIIELSGEVDVAQAEKLYLDMKKVVPKRKGFTILTDLSTARSVDPEIQKPVKKMMDFCNKRGVTKILRVIPDPTKDIGLNILSLFHYSKEVKFLTFQSRKEAQAHL